MLTDTTEETGSWVGRYLPIFKELSEHGHNVNVLLPHHNYHKINKEKKLAENFELHYIGHPFYGKRGKSRVHYPTIRLLEFGLINLLKMIYQGIIRNFDIIYLGKPLPVSGVVALVLRVIKDKPILLDCDDYEAYTNKSKGFVQHRIIKFFEDHLPFFSNWILANTPFTENRINSIIGQRCKILFLPNGVDKDRFSAPVFPSIYKTIKDKRIILYLGSLNLFTGHHVDILLQAMKYIIDNKLLENIVLVIVGDGPDEEYLQNLSRKLGLEKCVFWMSKVSPREAVNYLYMSDIVVDPVKMYEGNLTRCPLKIVEAMYMQKPVVTSDIGVRKTLLKDAGIYVKEGSAKELARGIIKILKDNELQANIKNKMKDYSREYLWDDLVDIIESEIFESPKQTM